jgi:hypothetical protein
MRRIPFLFVLIFISACAPFAEVSSPDPTASGAVISIPATQTPDHTREGDDSNPVTPSEIPERSEIPGLNRRVEDPNEYILSPLLPFDAIAPVYDPRFVQATDAPLKADELIIGIAWSGEAKAYPITVLRSREMVNDEMAGIPTLVTW